MLLPLSFAIARPRSVMPLLEYAGVVQGRKVGARLATPARYAASGQPSFRAMYSRHGGFANGSEALVGGNPDPARMSAIGTPRTCAWRSISPWLGKPSRGTSPIWAARALNEMWFHGVV